MIIVTMARFATVPLPSRFKSTHSVHGDNVMRGFNIFLIMLCSAGASAAQSNTPAIPAPRALPAPTIVSPRFVGTVFNLLALPNGMLLINDTRNHRVMLSDSLLQNTTVVIDSIDYGSRPASVLAYSGDSSVFVESVTPSARIIDPTGKPGRTMAVARPRDAGWLMPSPSYMAGIDARGRFVHRGLGPRVNPPAIKPGEVRFRTFSDTSPVIRDDPVTHNGDTIAWVRTGQTDGVEVARAEGGSMTYMRTNPVDLYDEWAVLANGSVAVLRGRDYHVDMIDANGKITALPKIPFPWVPLSDSAKAALIDSVRVAREAQQNTPRPGVSVSGSGSAGGGNIGGGGGPPGMDFPPAPPGMRDMKVSELGDYRPAFSFGALKAAADGNLWIRTRTVAADTGMVIYDIVSPEGKRLDRVLVPRNRTIVGFDLRGNVFWVGRAEEGVQWIERVRWKK